MPFDDPRVFLEYLEERRELIRISDEVDPKYEISAYIRKTSDQQGPALLFEKVKGHDMAVAGGIFASRRRVLLALETPAEEVHERFHSGATHPIAPRLVDTGPCKEVIWKGDEVDLTRLPIPTYAAKDGGAFITHGVQISKDPETGGKNASIYRMQLQGKRQLGLYVAEYQDMNRQYAKAEAKGQPLEVAVALGCDPVVMLATQVVAAYGEDELGIAGGLKGKPVDVVKCETVDLEVPATTEIVIEGRVLPARREAEGPFGEYSGYYGPAGKRPVVEVTAVTHRKNPIYHAGLTGAPMTENHFLKQIPNEVTLFRDLKAKFPGVKSIHYTAAGCCEYVVFISLKQVFPGEARKVIMAVLGSKKFPKYVVVCDDDIDVFDHVQVIWAMATRARPAEDFIILPKVPTAALDPSVPEGQLGSAVGIDATRPFGEPFPDVPSVPGMERVPDLLALMGGGAGGAGRGKETAGER
ncbi:MAG: UbiD family decarboxylase [Candidatus Tectomicrobia bacterium]|nr:UbiD family decarboxylase [Candidatus Tectomicrobia bacterium]